MAASLDFHDTLTEGEPLTLSDIRARADALPPARDESLHGDAYALARVLNSGVGTDRARNGSARTEAARALLAEHFPEPVADYLLAEWVEDRIGLRAIVVGADREGIYETDDGGCLRDSDPSSERPIIAIEVSTRFHDVDGARFRGGPTPTGTSAAMALGRRVATAQAEKDRNKPRRHGRSSGYGKGGHR